jgi:hypothetical protein
MRHTRLSGAIALILLAASASGQSDPPATLAGALRDHVNGEQFSLVTSIRGLPLGVRDELQTLFDAGSLDIAESWAEFQGTSAAADPKLPLRRLVAAGCSIDHCLVYYERGGSARTWVAALFHWTPAATRLEWGGNARGGLANIAAVRKAALSGAIKGPVKAW